MRFIDLAGLTRHYSPEYVAALALDDVTPIAPEHRLTMLKRLRNGAGVHVLTGPEAAAFWWPVSVEVHIDVVPDGYSYHERGEAGMEWALRAVGVPATVASKAATTYVTKEPTAKAALRPRWDQAKALLAEYETYTAEYGSIIVEASAITAVTDPAEALALLDRVETVAMDWEWNIDEAVGPMYAPEGLSVATADRTWYIPVVAKDFGQYFGYEDELRAAVQRTIMRTPTVWHDAKADLGSQWQGPPLDAFGAPMHCTLLMAFCAGQSDLHLKALTRSLMKRDPLDYPGAMRNLPLDVCTRYGGADSRNTYDLFGVLFNKLHEREQWGIYDEIERPIIPLLTDMERYGMPMDPQAAIVMRDALVEDEERIRALFVASDGLDISKDKETRELVRRRVGYDPGSVAIDALAKIPGEWMDLVLRYRKVRHRRRGFADKQIGKWHAAGEPDDFRLYTRLNQAGSADAHEQRSFKKAPRSGRLSSSSPDKLPPGAIGAPGGNLMNQPNEGNDDGFMADVPGSKGIFVAPRPDQVMWARDYKGLEMRITASMSGDENMRAAVMSADGPHVDFQTRIYEHSGLRIAKVGAKQGNFNAAYGGYLDMLRTILQKQRVFLPDDDLMVIIESYDKAYPDIKPYDQAIIERARRLGYSQSAFGRRRYDDDIFSNDRRISGHAERALINHEKGQGTAADMIKIAMRLSVPVLKYYDAHMCLQVHDEMVGWCDADIAEEFLFNFDRAIAPVQLPGVLFEVDGGYGRTWRDAKP